LWQWILPFAAYGFNKSHSAAYATIAYQTAYLKAHYPVEFMAAVLTSEKADVERISFLIDECKKMNVEVLPPNINESLKNFTVVEVKNQIGLGFLVVKNVGINIIEATTEERKARGRFKSIGDFIHRIDSKNLNKKSMEALIKSGAFDEFAERNQLLTNLERMLEIAREKSKNQNTNQMGLFANTTAINNDIKLDPATPASNFTKLGWEKELLGLYVSSHPLNGFKKLFASRTVPIIKINDTFVDKKVIVGGLISSVKKIITKKGQPMLFIKLEDLTGRLEVVIFPNLLERNPAALQENKIVFVGGRVDDRNNELKLVADDVQEILVPHDA
jgi:DNA polymerase-3 subunit alpha